MPELKDLFLERESELYNYVRYPYKEDGDTQPYRYTTLDNAEPMNNTFFEDQSNPVSLSARRDFNRMFQFSKSAQGLVFLGKQTFLQTGNTFAQTRLYNPLNVQIHSVPFVHLTRHIDVKQTIQSIIGGSTSEEYAKLQTENIAEYRRIGVNRTRSKGGMLNLSSPSNNAIGGIRDRIIDTFNDTINGFVSGYKAQFTNPTGGRPEANTERLLATHFNGVLRRLRGTKPWITIGNRPGDSRGLHLLSGEDGKSYLELYADSKKDNVQYQGVYYNIIGNPQESESPEGSIRFRYDSPSPRSVIYGGTTLKTVVDKEIDKNKEKNEKYIQEVSQYLSSSRGHGKNIPFLGTGSFSNGTFTALTRYYKDPMTAPTILKTDIPRGQDVDSIDVIFHNLSGPVSDPNTDTGTRLVRNYDVRFRAFIKDINESITPTYNENKYIGRYETFYTYNKVTRDLSFELTIQAFSKDEIKRILDRMSLLTSFAYPKVSRGTNYQTPSIFKVTIGKLYTVQPCILQSLTHRIEEDVSWDIDEQIPMSVKCNMQLRLLDKKSYDTFSFDIYKDTNITLGV